MESEDIKNAGLKVTLPRMKILELMERSEDRHLKAEDIYKMLLDSGEEIALATVYRVLTQFETAGLVSRQHFDGGHAVFEITKLPFFLFDFQTRLSRQFSWLAIGHKFRDPGRNGRQPLGFVGGF